MTGVSLLHEQARASPSVALFNWLAARAWRTIERHNVWLAAIAAVALAAVAIGNLGQGFNQLLHVADDSSQDLSRLHRWVDVWFRGEPLYEVDSNANYPPLSLLLLAPLLRSVTLESARRIWLWSYVVLLTGVAVIFARSCGSRRLSARCCAGLLPLVMQATSCMISHGQLGLHALTPVLLASLLTIRTTTTRALPELGIVGLFVVSLTKISISLPFFWFAVLFPVRINRVRTVLLAGVVAVLSVVATTLQESSFRALHQAWLARASALPVLGYGNVCSLLGSIDAAAWCLPASAIVMLSAGAWVHCHRSADPWTLVGVVAIISRVWTYHELYDDVIVVVPMLALLRRFHDESVDVRMRLLCLIAVSASVVVSWLPIGWRYSPPPWIGIYSGFHLITWAAMLVLLHASARPELSRGGLVAHPGANQRW